MSGKLGQTVGGKCQDSTNTAVGGWSGNTFLEVIALFQYLFTICVGYLKELVSRLALALPGTSEHSVPSAEGPDSPRKCSARFSMAKV